MTVAELARICHEANKALCESVGDFTQKHWEEAEDWQRESSIKGVEFAIENPHAPANAQHNAWSDEKFAAGWKYGPVKDVEKKEHPCLVPFEQLPVEQQAKDHLFKAIVNSLSLLVV